MAVSAPRQRPTAAPVALPRPEPSHLFPGDRTVWRVGAAVLALMGVITLIALLVPRSYLTGSNSVAGRDAVAAMGPQEKLCVPDVQIPAGTGAVRFAIDTRTDPRPDLFVSIL